MNVTGLSGNDKNTRRRRGPYSYRPATLSDTAAYSGPNVMSSSAQSSTVPFCNIHQRTPRMRAAQRRRKVSPTNYSPWSLQQMAKPRPIKLFLHFVIVLVSVVFLASNFTFLMNSKEIDSRSEREDYVFSRKRAFTTFENPPTHSETMTQALHSYSKQRRRAQKQALSRKLARQKRTRPPPRTESSEKDRETMKLYVFDLLYPTSDEHSTLENKEVENGDEKPPNLCDRETLNMHSSNPSFYPSLHNVNTDSVVLITGILSQLGFHLAMSLVANCGVKVMIGVAEALYPEDSSYRLRLLEQISVLYSSLPSFKRPLIVAFNGVNPKLRYYQNFEPLVDVLTGEMDYFAITPPTHIVHITSTWRYFHQQDNWHDKHLDSPYRKHSGVFKSRQSIMGTEQLLANLVKSDSHTHFTLVSDTDVRFFETTRREARISVFSTESKRAKHLYTATKLMEEVMVRAYAETLNHNTFAIVRMPIIYGPWGKSRSFDSDLAQKAIMHWHDKGTMSRDSDSDDSILLSLTGLSERCQDEEDLLFVDDAIDAMIAVMQHSRHNSNISTFSLLSGEKTSPRAIADLIETFMPISTHLRPKVQIHAFHDGEGRYIAPNLAMTANNLLRWTPQINMRLGITKLLAWHLDEHLPFGSYIHDDTDEEFPLHARQSGGAFLRAEKQSSCPPDDLYCLRGHHIYPCVSECSDPVSCTNSAFDHASELSKVLTENCEIVLYTTLLGNDVDEIAVQAPDTENASICSVAYISQRSILVEVSSVGERIDDKQTENIGVDYDFIVHKGWSLIPIDVNDSDYIPADFRFILQLSPGNFFHSSVKAALYLAEDFTLNPTVEDIQFTTDLLHRKSAKHPPYQINAELEKLQYSVGHLERHALVVLPAIRSDNGDAKKVISGTAPTTLQKKTFRKALGQMMGQKQASKEAMRQKEFYSQIPGFFNRCEFSPHCESSFKFILNHWTRHSWVAHSFPSKEARNLRCEWYREHAKWDNENISLSFSQVITRLQIELFNSLFDENDREKMLVNQAEKEIDGSTDDHEWHGIVDKESRKKHFVRILDERSMIIQRRLWKIRQKLNN